MVEITKYEQVWDIWNQSKNNLHAYVLSRFKNKSLAEEVTQEVLLKIHKSCCSNRKISNLNSWLYQIAHNLSLDILKAENRQSELDAAPEADDYPEDWGELEGFLEPLINLLPEKYGIPVKMSDLDGIPQKEIAERLGLGLSATKSRIQRGREKLKEEILGCYRLETDKNGVPIQLELRDSCSTLQALKKNK